MDNCNPSQGLILAIIIFSIATKLVQKLISFNALEFLAKLASLILKILDDTLGGFLGTLSGNSRSERLELEKKKY